MQVTLFYILSSIILLFSLLCVSSKKVLRSAVYLLFVLIATAGYYFLFGYFFLGAVQLSLYAGGIIVLIIFSIMLTNKVNENVQELNLTKGLLALGAGVAGLLIVWLIIIRDTIFNILPTTTGDGSVKTVAKQLVGYGENGYALPFEVISILLLAVMIGAIIVAKKRHDLKQ